MIPGINSKALSTMQIDDRQLLRMEAILNSMTVRERLYPSLLNG